MPIIHRSTAPRRYCVYPVDRFNRTYNARRMILARVLVYARALHASSTLEYVSSSLLLVAENSRRWGSETQPSPRRNDNSFDMRQRFMRRTPAAVNNKVSNDTRFEPRVHISDWAPTRTIPKVAPPNRKQKYSCCSIAGESENDWALRHE
jgi:hypothetical protein